MAGGWGKAGVRLTEKERERIHRRAARDRNELKARQRSWAAEAERAWKRGLINPQMITMALDARELYGPEVDIKCGVEEPAVDMWEAGELYPTWPQFVALAELTQFPLQFFYEDRPQIDGGFICTTGPGGGCHSIVDPDGPTRYAREVVSECPGTDWAAS